MGQPNLKFKLRLTTLLTAAALISGTIKRPIIVSLQFMALPKIRLGLKLETISAFLILFYIYAEIQWSFFLTLKQKKGRTFGVLEAVLNTFFVAMITAAS